MSANPRQELCQSGGGSEGGCSNNLVDVDAEMGTYEEAQVPENSGGREVTSLDMDVSLEPYVGKEFKSEHEAKAFYNGYARYMGFTIRKNSLYRSARDRAVTSRVFVCSKEGFRRQRSADKGDVKRRTKITRVGCKALLWVKKQPSGMWVVKQFHREHNHELTPMKVDLLRSPKNMLDNVKDYVETLKAAGIETSIIQRLFIEEAHRIGGMGDADTDIQSEEKKKIHELSLELKRERRRSATYREQLNVVLKEMENHAHHISTQVEDVVRSIKEVESQGIINERNENLKLKNRTGAGIVPYQLLKPSSKPGVTGMGVPNSISI